jgi:hypothetical protein
LYLTRVATAVFDPSRGGFSGAQIAADLVPGWWYTDRTAYLTLDAPALQYTDPVAGRSGQRFASLLGSFGTRGELVFNRYYYNASAQVSHSRTDAVSITGAGPDLLQPAGVAPDSAARFLSVLRAAGIPMGSQPSARGTTTASFATQLDHRPGAEHSWALTALGTYTTADASLTPLVTPSTGIQPSSYSTVLQARRRDFIGQDWLNTLRSGLSLSGNRSNPAVRVPSGSVLVSSTFADGSGGVANLGFAGSGSSGMSATRWTWDAIDELALYGQKRPHKLKLFAESRLDGFANSAGASYGSYAYASIDDVAANRPSSYSRILATPQVHGGEWSGALAMGDNWRTRRLALLFGARVEANRYAAAPPFNPAVQSAFAARTNATPDRVHVSPRLGFSYSLAGSPLDRWGTFGTPIAFRTLPLKGVLRGGIGEFRSLMPPDLLSGPAANTGLANASRRLYCVGTAVPAPDWSALAAGEAAPERCADGAGAFVDASPAVRLIDPSFDAARSWRANLGWSGVFSGFGLTIDGFYSLNLNQPGLVDLNFAGTPDFTLGDEGRPVFVDPSAIVPSTGALSPLGARGNAAFGRVLSQRSDLRGTSRQFTVTLSPYETGLKMGPSGGYFATFAYTLADARAQTRGFDGAAFGDPGVRETVPSPLDIRHTLILQAGWYRSRVSASAFGTLRSGAPFTPIVNGDVNGDGVGGDRAFVFDAAHAADPALAAGMRSLLATSSGRVRDCLERQQGRAAEVYSCRGPWTASLNAQLSYSLGRSGLTVNLTNPLGGLDQLLHGPDHLRGWGADALPDPMLLSVRGFDPTTRRFVYQVNPRFGSTSPSATTLRAPFRLTLDVRLNLGRSYNAQEVERAVVIAHRLPPAALRRELSVIPDLFGTVLEMSDSLLLTTEQTTALEAARDHYRVRMDSLWAALAEYIGGLPDNFDRSAAIAHQDSVREQGWVISHGDFPAILTILTPLQQALLPPRVIRIIKGEKYMIIQ